MEPLHRIVPVDPNYGQIVSLVERAIRSAVIKAIAVGYGPVIDLFPKRVHRFIPVYIEFIDLCGVYGLGIARVIKVITHLEGTRRNADKPGVRGDRKRG